MLVSIIKTRSRDYSCWFWAIMKRVSPYPQWYKYFALWVCTKLLFLLWFWLLQRAKFRNVKKVLMRKCLVEKFHEESNAYIKKIIHFHCKCKEKHEHLVLLCEIPLFSWNKFIHERERGKVCSALLSLAKN